MDFETAFYQISGFQAHSSSWFQKFNDKLMIRKIMESKTLRRRGKDTPIELVLGILPSGASYLLMPQEQAFKFARDHNVRIDRAREPWKATQFLSLSPIYFNDADALAAKIATYKQRPRNKNRREHEVPKDNSQANRGYVLAGADMVHHRAYFEHQRTLYRLLVGDLQPGRVALASPPWLGRGVRVVSLVLGEWSVDIRPRSKRLSDPRLVDVGWTDTTYPSFFEHLTGKMVHLKLTSPVKMINPCSKNPYVSDIVEDDQVGLERRLRALLYHDAEQSGIPLIVLVHDEDMARGILSRAGIDLGGWTSGLSHLLPIAALNRDTPKPSIVDVQRLVRAVMETDPGRTVPHSAKVLHMQTGTKTCAGDDSVLLLRMWTSMAQGLAIDEQHKAREAHEPTCAQVLGPPPTNGADDVDPNDVDPNDADVNDIPPGLRPTIEDDFSSDDDW